MKKLIFLCFLAVVSCSKDEDKTCSCEQFTENNYAEANLMLSGFANNYGSDTEGWVVTGVSEINTDCARNGERKEITKVYAGTANGIKVYKINRSRIDCN